MNMQRQLTIFSVIAALACASYPTAAQSSDKGGNGARSAAKVEQTKEATPEYRIGAGDVLRISVYQNPDLQLEARVSESGIISYPLLGNVVVGGMSTSQAEKVLTDGLKAGNFIKNPQVTILILQVRGNQANVLGQVGRPGRYPLEQAENRLTDLIATAGGIIPSGSDVITVSGDRDGKPFWIEIDINSIFERGGKGLDITIKNGDVIWVDRYPLVYIYGEVQRPGPLRLERGMTLMQVLASGGGVSARGTVNGIKVHRKDASGKVVVVEPKMDEILKNGDVVYVKESLF
ncbi:polysaccharide export protein EpsE [Roseateles sp. BYS180W]|uniref:Polysaccharide export protein EpsE n=1 Tax=Roseateles rivi TaxID=3299028 RepID=A0ABW7FSG8_9BURK